MASKHPQQWPERQNTDKGLTTERRKTDEELRRHEGAIETGTDANVEQARHRADEALEGARQRVDEASEQTSHRDPRRRTLEHARAQEDAALRRERVAIDEELMGERQDRNRVLENLLRFEREHTDAQLQTERLRADHDLTASGDLVGAVFMQLPTPMCLTRGREHVFEFANPAFVRLVGKSELVGKSVRAAFPELEGHPFFRMMDHIFQSGEPFHDKETPVRLDGGPDGASGDERFFDFIHQPLRGHDGMVNAIATCAFEVTGQVLAREKIRAAERRALFLGEASRQLGASLDLSATLEGLARLALPSLADFCIVDVLEDDGRTVARIASVHSDKRKQGILEELHRLYPVTSDSVEPAAVVLRTGKPELLIRETPEQIIGAHTRDAAHAALLGQLGICSYMAVPMLAGGRVVGALSFGLTDPWRRYILDDLVLAQDIAERAAYAVDNARHYRDAKQAIRTRDEFLSIASHELNTPLTPIRLHLQGLRRQLKDEETGKPIPSGVGRKLETIDRQIRRLESLINGLLDVSRLTDQRPSLEVEPVDLSAIVTEVVGRLRDEADQAKSPLRVEVPPLLIGEWDRHGIDQVVTNLVGNGLKFGAGKPVVVSVTSDGVSARIVVRDSGVGIAPADHARIFERYERAVPVRHFGGFGLGLWVAHRIVQALGGTISVESETGRGAAFTVVLPLKRTRSDT